MKQLFYHELKQQEISSKNIVMVKRMKKVFPINIVVGKNLLLHLRVSIQDK